MTTLFFTVICFLPGITLFTAVPPYTTTAPSKTVHANESNN
jgi:hypothetical protein